MTKDIRDFAAYVVSESGNEEKPLRATCDKCGIWYDRTSILALENIMKLHLSISHSKRTRKQEREFMAAGASTWIVK